MSIKAGSLTLHGWFLLLSLGLNACAATAETPPPTKDQGIELAADLGDDTFNWPDANLPDTGPRPDSPIPADRGPKPDANPCGNGKLDKGELCDPKIKAGNVGACPLSCDDKNICTTDQTTGSAATCDMVCSHAPIANCCGNGSVEGSEECDDGNVLDRDGCSNKCLLPGGHLLITEVSISPTEAEYIELFNPSASALPLDTVYLSDRIDFYALPGGALKSVRFDFIARFPPGATIKPGAYVVVAFDALKYKVVFTKAPDFEIKGTDATVPDMVAPAKGLIGSTAGLTDPGELVIAFQWDGKTDRVADLDYLVWKGASATAIFRQASTCLDGPDANTTPSCYKTDTAVTQQSSIVPPQKGGSMQRCDYLETGEKKSGGNGLTGHDETSESFGGKSSTWKRNPNTPTHRTPGGPAPLGFCPP